MDATVDALPRRAGPHPTDFIRSPLRVFLLGTLAFCGYFLWWLWQLFELAKRDRFPRATTFFAIFIPLYGYVVLFQAFKDLNNRARARLVGGFSPLLCVLLFWLSNILGLGIRAPGPSGLVALLASGLLFGAVSCSAQGAANRYLRAAYPTRPAGVMSLGEAIASGVGLLVFFIIASTSIAETRALLAAGDSLLAISSTSVAHESKPGTPYVTPSAARPADGFSFTSEPREFVGQGRSESFVPPSARFFVLSSSGNVNVTIQMGGTNWNVELAAPAGQALQPGSYLQAQRAGFATGSAPGLDVFGDSRGCSFVFGEFTISQLVFDQRGRLWALQATFIQHCEFAAAPALRGTLTYGAPDS